jgi:molybdopterin converting factor subunit 1
MKVSILLFAMARELVGASEVVVEAQGDSTDSSTVIALLLEHYPALADIMATSILAVNHEYVEKGTVTTIRPGDEVAVIPPVSGG